MQTDFLGDAMGLLNNGNGGNCELVGEHLHGM